MTERTDERRERLDRTIALADIERMERMLRSTTGNHDMEQQLKSYKAELYGEVDQARLAAMMMHLEQMDRQLQQRQRQREEEQAKEQTPLEKLGKTFSGEMGR